MTGVQTCALPIYLAEQNGLCELGRAYLAEKQSAIIASGIFGDISEETVRAVVERMSAKQLDEFYKAAAKKTETVKPQLRSEENASSQNGGFMIK